MAKQQDAISVLRTDHQRVRSLFSEMLKPPNGGGPREELLEELLEELRVHTQLEEEIFYPAFREAATDTEDEHFYYESMEEHHVVDLVMPEVEQQNPGTMTFAAKVKVLHDIVEHHLEEEEEELFPLVRELCAQETLEELGQQILSRKQDLLGEQPEQPAGPIDLNTATKDQLSRIEGIDGVRAERIIGYRDEHSGFTDWEELYDIEGIDGAMVARIKRESRLGG